MRVRAIGPLTTEGRESSWARAAPEASHRSKTMVLVGMEMGRGGCGGGCQRACARRARSGEALAVTTSGALPSSTASLLSTAAGADSKIAPGLQQSGRGASTAGPVSADPGSVACFADGQHEVGFIPGQSPRHAASATTDELHRTPNSARRAMAKCVRGLRMSAQHRRKRTAAQAPSRAGLWSLALSLLRSSLQAIEPSGARITE